MWCVVPCIWCFFFFFKQKTAYEMRISDWSSDVCSSDLEDRRRHLHLHQREHHHREPAEQQRSAPWLSQRKSSATRTSPPSSRRARSSPSSTASSSVRTMPSATPPLRCATAGAASSSRKTCARSEEHTPELPSLIRISYAAFCLKKIISYTP